MKQVIIYTTRYCPFCIGAKQLLDQKGVAYDEIPVDHDPELRLEMARKAGKRTVPQIWIADHHVGGCTELFALEQSGELNQLLTH